MSQLDENAISKVQEMTAASLNIPAVDALDCPSIIVPSNYKIQSLEHLEAGRYRFRGFMATTSINDFVRYSCGYAGAGVRCFIDADEMEAVAVFNIGTLDSPGHADNSASISLKKTSPFRALLAIDGQKNKQKQLAEWLEDWRDYLTAFDAEGDVVDIKQAIGSVRRITIEAISTAEHEDNDFSGKRSVMESIEARSKDVMPVAFEFKCIPYDGLSERRFKLRFSILTSDTPLLVLRIVQLETAEEEMATEFRDLLISKFDGVEIESFIGKFKA